jgi:hypothetical protein
LLLGASPFEMATGVLLPKLAADPLRREHRSGQSQEGMIFYEKEYKAQCLGAGDCRFPWYIRFRGG